jgi:hypothetical protein
VRNEVESRGSTDTVAVACSLDAAAFEARREEWAALRVQALIDQQTQGLVVTSRWRRADGVLDQLGELVGAEQSCCPFLRFDLSEGGSVITLRVTFPEGVGPEVWDVLA